MTTSSSRDEGDLRSLVICIQDNSLVCYEGQFRNCGDEGGEGTWDEGIDCCFGEVMFGRHLNSNMQI